MPLIQRNIIVDSDIWAKFKAEAIARNKNVRNFAGEIVSDHIMSKNKVKKIRDVKAIIIAAGMSSRLMELTDDKPKCMLEVNDKTLLQRQIEIFKHCGIDEIIVIRGYKKEKINYVGVKYIYNMNYRRNNILESLMAAEKEMVGEVIITYSDILFKRNVVEKLLESKDDISIIIDTDWKDRYKDRFQHPFEEAENVIVEKNKVKKISKIINPNDAYGEFIGMAKFSKKGSEIWRKNYHEVKKQFGNNPFHTAISIEKAYLTDMFQELIDRGYTVSSVDIKGDWMEIDTLEDISKAETQWD
jgi:choline kinase